MSQAREIKPKPQVTLIKYFDNPYDNVVATARTCYSPVPVLPEEVSSTPKARKIGDKIFKSIYEAGHHTTLQHPTFQFLISNVSRQFVWSFLHSHPFYNSEQVSQRYVEVKPDSFLIPPLTPSQTKLYTQTIELQTQAYNKLIQLLEPDVRRIYFEIFPGRKRHSQKWETSIHRRTLEIARYILPVATLTHLYHTISGLTLYRYYRICQGYDVPLETREVVERMIQEVRKIDEKFIEHCSEPISLEETLEFQQVKNFYASTKNFANRQFIEEFDTRLDGRYSRLIDYKANAESTLAFSVRSLLGLSSKQIGDAEAIELVVNPAKNKYFCYLPNLATLSKICRAMYHPHFTFLKKLSHCADSQNQRHRMTPASRPILFLHFDCNKPDFVLPEIIKQNSIVAEFFEQTLAKVWEGVRRLLNEGVDIQYVLYLLPNAFPVRLVESGDFLNFHHKWVTRLCFLAQEEIWRISLDEVKQVRVLFPALVKYVRPICFARKMAGIKPHCPEGVRFCGLPVWDMDINNFARVI